MDPTPKVARRNRLTSSATEKSRNSWLKKQTTSPQPLPPTSLFLQRDYLKMVFSQLQDPKGGTPGSLMSLLLFVPGQQPDCLNDLFAKHGEPEIAPAQTQHPE